MECLSLYKYKEYVLEYLSFGHGKKVMLCFHGFSRNADDFICFEPAWKEEYTVYSFNFFHHGNSIYPEDRIDKNTLSDKEWNEIIISFLKNKNIENFSLSGYSMGGKLCLSIYLQNPSRVKEIYLFAPDGLKENFWYKFTSGNLLGNWLYRKIIKHPSGFFSILKLLKNTRLLHEKLYRFVMLNLENENKRRLVYNVWMTLRHIRPNKKAVIGLLLKSETKMYLFFGRYDRVIPAHLGKVFIKKCPSNSSLYIIECGHNLFNENTLHKLTEINKNRIYS